MQIGIINYNMGNLASVQNAFEAIGAKAQIQKDPSKLSNYDKLILPGVGAFGDAAKNLENTGMKEAVLDFVKRGRYVLGICLGMQLLFEKSQEFGEHKGLGLIKGEVIKFQIEKSNLKIPHMGWNQCIFSENASKHPLLKNIQDKTYLYFVHSYHALCADPQNLLAKCIYGYPFAAIVAKDNIFGLQPHPEKSHHEGLKILKNFVTL
ncbi:imidazole glycerol phosphate synthase, glutamine amidotransferase subunit [Helicobacter sp. 12S02232-10]|uniref:imidazole glycerol phosphate synthase subunit HisH n=1 Tax=Helicobacter sp. 12S02232-10 TaxID=1476197 RepID=UPI000BA50753|nr:imidazole glycerol phosphate synthase subunit HisH [Helicobacter sp. 12S02232-10]PAF47892.1 imidazole glycerol phosphate synthase, glutamine amidotransferase subunit [Helicobacter sp. 12S02232-10]